MQIVLNDPDELYKLVRCDAQPCEADGHQFIAILDADYRVRATSVCCEDHAAQWAEIRDKGWDTAFPEGAWESIRANDYWREQRRQYEAWEAEHVA